MTGEFITVTTNVPQGATARDLADTINLITEAIDNRLKIKNAQVEQKNAKNFKEMGFTDEQLERLNLAN